MSDAARRIAVYIDKVKAAPIPVVARTPQRGKGKIAPKPVAPKRRPMHDEAPARRKSQVELKHDAGRLSPQQKQAWMKHSYQQQVEYLEQHPNSIFKKIGITRRAPKQNTNDDAQADDDQNRDDENPQTGGDEAGGEESDGEENNDPKNDAAEVNDAGKEIGEPSPLDKETRPLTADESAAGKARVEELSQDGALEPNSPQREASAAVIEQDAAQLLHTNLPDSDKADIAQGLAETQAAAKAGDDANTETEDDEDDDPDEAAAVKKDLGFWKTPGGQYGGFKYRKQQVRYEEWKAQQGSQGSSQEQEDRENRRLDRAKQDKIDDETRQQQYTMDREHRLRGRELEDRDYRHNRKERRSQKKMRYALGALAIAGLLGVGIFAVSPGIAMGLGIHMMDHIGKLFAASRDDDDDDDRGRRGSYAALRKLPDILLLAEEGNKDAIAELARLAADYVRRGQLPEDLLDNLRRQVKL